MHKHRRVGIWLGLAIIALFGGVVGYNIGKLSPDVVNATFKVGKDSAPVVGALFMAVFAATTWGLFEIISSAAKSISHDVLIVRLTISLAGSLFSLITAELDLLGINIFPSTGHTIFSYFPLASGLASIALGARALVHQVNLDREDSRSGRGRRGRRGRDDDNDDDDRQRAAQRQPQSQNWSSL